jgi:5-formyltetrahydrofolate cyclo-ligase
MKKKDIRHYYKDRRSQLTAAQIEKMDDLMLIQFQKLAVETPSLLMTYAAIQQLREFDPQLITDFCFFRNPDLQLLYPVMDALDGKNELIAVLVNDDTTFNLNEYNIPEPIDGQDVSPSSIDMVIVPLLGFDSRGYRVGYGKGFYDRFLQQCRPDCIKIGFSYFEPVQIIEDICQYDIPLNFCITHETIYAF